ncbi:hypothetical protein CLF_111223 [Clonorchis sinensis]|uniref:Integrase catalytic domain-containing protein n=1 Tax=Clonorchis sinensis TaxID=79923 RepID=G7YLI4_CLOSI|nr:hypothetical protein CLF_111223 [Clonorchis sinensis]
MAVRHRKCATAELTVVDEYSRFPFPYPCPDTSSPTVIAGLVPLYATFGLSGSAHSDSGSSFISDESEQFLHIKAVATSRTTPNRNGLGNLPVAQPSCFPRMAWQLGIERELQLDDFSIKPELSDSFASEMNTTEQRTRPISRTRSDSLDILNEGYVFLASRLDKLVGVFKRRSTVGPIEYLEVRASNTGEGSPNHPWNDECLLSRFFMKQAGQQVALARTLDSLWIDVCCLSETKKQDASTVIELTASSPSSRFRLRNSGDAEAAAAGYAGPVRKAELFGGKCKCIAIFKELTTLVPTTNLEDQEIASGSVGVAETPSTSVAQWVMERSNRYTTVTSSISVTEIIIQCTSFVDKVVGRTLKNRNANELRYLMMELCCPLLLERTPMNRRLTDECPPMGRLPHRYLSERAPV